MDTSKSYTEKRAMGASASCVKLTRYFYSAAERTDADLKQQLEQAAVMVEEAVTRTLLPYQYDALVCLASDIVAGLVSSSSVDFQHSFLLSAVNKGMFQVAAAEFHVFCYTSGRVSRRAWEKRRAEQYLFTRGQLLFD